ncbi:hypothetical protein FOA43_000468 [Brettanomyces nanus]|uniref:Major facilitator superfamily (MFS) profile domain-containing protein n=1 Tax=Eeniella nana TaxID=13502 RepID=A0A875RZ24_EENNA|nr:uncharacterized protein FOA43_000468 [Brettanomyces nanus]QPG73162.1 hypothetical protein FOA43_000468 [Brettanomyces nanus]
MDSEKDAKTSSMEEEVKAIEAPAFVDVKHMFRKVDFVLLPIMMFTYAVQFMDKLALSAGSVFGLRTDLKLVNQDYSWASSIFFFGFMLGNFFVVRLIHLVKIGRFVSFVICAWGITLACSTASQNYAGLLVARFVLGFLESAISPTFVFITSMWWTQKQQAVRTNLWFAGNDIGGVLNSLIAFGLGHANGPWSPWRYIFLTYGLMAFVWSFVILFFLPDSPQNARFLNQGEKQYYQKEMKSSKVDKKWDWGQAKSAFTDIQVWLLLFSTVLCVLPNAGITSYGFIILDSFGFTSIQSTLLNLALSIFTWFAIALAGYLASRFKNARCYVIWLCLVFAITGGCLIYKGNSKGVKLLGYFLVDVQPAILPLLLGMAASNFRGTTRRSTVNSAIFIIYCACNIGGPQLFQSSDAPHYPHAFLSWIICYCLNVVFTLLIRLAAIRANKKLEKLAAEFVPVVEEEIEVEKELVEYEDPSFRYKY